MIELLKTHKRDRATSLSYGLSVINEMEEYNRKNMNPEEEEDALQYQFFD